MFYKIVFRLVAIIFVFASVSLYFQQTSTDLISGEPARVGLATLLSASLAGSGIFFLIMSFTQDVKAKIMTASSLIVWLLLNQIAHTANVIWRIESDLVAPIIFNGILIILAGVVIYQEKVTLNKDTNASQA